MKSKTWYGVFHSISCTAVGFCGHYTWKNCLLQTLSTAADQMFCFFDLCCVQKTNEWQQLKETSGGPWLNPPGSGHSVFYPVKLWICSGMETMQPLWSVAPIFDHPNFSKVIQISNGNTLCCSLHCYFPSFHWATLLTSKNFPCFSQSDMTAWSGGMLIGSFLIVFSLTPSTTKHQFLIALFLNRSRHQKHLLPENSDKAPMFLQTRLLAFPVLSSWW